MAGECCMHEIESLCLVVLCIFGYQSAVVCVVCFGINLPYCISYVWVLVYPSQIGHSCLNITEKVQMIVPD